MKIKLLMQIRTKKKTNLYSQSTIKHSVKWLNWCHYWKNIICGFFFNKALIYVKSDNSYQLRIIDCFTEQEKVNNG